VGGNYCACVTFESRSSRAIDAPTWLQRTKSWRPQTNQKSGARRLKGMETMPKVRQASRFDPCDVLDEVMNATSRVYVFRRPGGEIGMIAKNAPTLHLRACTMCADYHQHRPLCEAA
jgi:hypothetical protein